MQGTMSHTLITKETASRGGLQYSGPLGPATAHCPCCAHKQPAACCSSHPVPAANRRVDLHRVPGHDLGAERERGSLTMVPQTPSLWQGQWGLVERHGYVSDCNVEVCNSCTKTFCTVCSTHSQGTQVPHTSSVLLGPVLLNRISHGRRKAPAPYPACDGWIR